MACGFDSHPFRQSVFKLKFFKITNKQKLIEQLIDQVKTVPYRDNSALDALKKRSEMYIRNIFGESSKYLDDLNKIRFSPSVYPAEESYYMKAWSNGITQLKNLYNTMSEEVSIFGSENDTLTIKDENNIQKPKQKNTEKVFVVHGHNNGIKNEVARYLEKLELTTVILHERPNSGKTIVEKFEDESSQTDFAVILLTADDQGSEISDSQTLKLRARQNVIFEFGYFMGKMGRSKVVALVEDGVEIPSDYSGVVYIQIDRSGAWKLELAKELKTAGLKVDLNLAI
ncbi:MAG: nucleotide-binding protein [Candidatus Shapirobacteria bacterium]|nr:nucleotide-binding protein [Candidatus Shapirobacteria bacterium]